MSKKVALFLVDGFEEIEALAPIDILRRAGIVVDTISVKNTNSIISSRKITVLSDKLIEDINFDDYEMIVLPGGPGTDNYYGSELLLEKLKEFSITKYIAAICAAPSVLSSLGILIGKEAVCFPSYEEKLVEDGAILTLKNVVTYENIITSRGAGTAIDFGLEIIKVLLGKEKSEEIKKQILYNEF